MKTKFILFILSVLALLLVGCSSPEEPVNNTEKLEEVVSEEQINIHFKWRDKELEDGDTYSFIIVENPEDPEDPENPTAYEVSQTLAVTDGKLGFSVKVKDNTWSISDIYFESNREAFCCASHMTLSVNLKKQIQRTGMPGVFQAELQKLLPASPVRDHR